MKNYLTLFLLFFLYSVGKTQITTNELPPSFQEKQMQLTQEAPPLFELQRPDTEKLLKEDEVDEKDGTKPWRFGTAIPVSINLKNNGEWLPGPSGKEMKWILSISAKKAESINLNLDSFHLSSNARLFIFNKDRSDVLGAITASNNKKEGNFATRPIQGNYITLELYTPTSELDSNIIVISEIIYGYKKLHQRIDKVFNSSSSCNKNIICPEGTPWKDVKRSVVMITAANNTRLCTGTLLNNVREDSRPFMLTAAHCNIRSNAIFIFNYESPNCSPSVDGPLAQSISNASFRAISTSSDFHLMELSTPPPANFNALYAGWSVDGAAAPRSAAIHHPVGDVKKISINDDSLISSGYYTTNGNTHWTVNNWDLGTTQAGSSGSALFDQNQRVVGQLHGGDAACGNNASDYYGKLSASWYSFTDSTKHLRFWLDPDTTGVLSLDPFDPNPAPFNYNLQVLDIGNVPSYFCDTVINPVIAIKNLGNLSVDSITINYNVDNGSPQSLTWKGSLNRQKIAFINLPSIIVAQGTHQLNISAAISGPNADQDLQDNSGSFSFRSTKQALYATVFLKTDDYGEESSWDIKVQNTNSVLYGQGPFPSINGGGIYSKQLCLFKDCFDITLYDSFSDGFNGSFGNGHLLVLDSNNDTLVYENNFTTASKTLSFCLPKVAASIDENAGAKPLIIFPNPVKKGENIFFKHTSGTYKAELFDINGKLVVSSNKGSQMNIPSAIRNGVYVIVLTAPNGHQHRQKLIIQ
jgi:hypothetical protein